MRKITMVLVLAMSMVLISACSQQPDSSSPNDLDSSTSHAQEGGKSQYHIRIATVVSGVENTWIKTAAFMEEEIEKRSEGLIEVSVFPGGQLGNDEACIDNMRIGTLDVLIGGTQNMAPFVSPIQTLSLSYMFESSEDFMKVIEKDGPVHEYIQTQYDNNGLNLRLLGLFYGGERNLYTNKEIKNVKDLKDMKMRVTSSATESLVWSELGVIPTSMSFNDIYSAVQTNTVSAFECTAGAYNSNALYEVAPYVIHTAHQYTPVHITFSSYTYDKLPSNMQLIIEDVSSEALNLASSMSIEQDQAMLNKLVSEKGVTVCEVDREEFKSIVEPIYPEIVAASNGEELMEIISNVR